MKPKISSAVYKKLTTCLLSAISIHVRSEPYAAFMQAESLPLFSHQNKEFVCIPCYEQRPHSSPIP